MKKILFTTLTILLFIISPLSQANANVKCDIDNKLYTELRVESLGNEVLWDMKVSDMNFNRYFAKVMEVESKYGKGTATQCLKHFSEVYKSYKLKNKILNIDNK